MTADFIPNEPGLEAAPAYPVVFGIALTPTIGGVALALAGLGIGAYVLLNLVQPEWQRNQELDSKVRDKQAQVQQLQNLTQQIEKAKGDLATVKKQREDVLSLFASEATLNTLVLDINRQVESRNANLATLRQAKLATCPAWVRQNLADVEKQAGALVVRAQMVKFAPDAKLSGIITDGSYGPLVNNKLKRQVASVTLRGNFNQTQQIINSLERLQPLLVLKNLESKIEKTSQLYEIKGNRVQYLTTCQPETPITTTFQLEALSPLTPEEMAIANPPPAPTPPK